MFVPDQMRIPQHEQPVGNSARNKNYWPNTTL